MANRLYVDRLASLLRGQDRNYSIDVYDSETNIRFARLVLGKGGCDGHWTVLFDYLDKRSERDTRLSFALATIYEHLEDFYHRYRQGTHIKDVVRDD